ncbi:hypothetical protein TRFO_19772 [Tritrichomonas foetus]|uniref:Uncharacterized protein n=1 Tax=Tritrichomonas foetus TaxID=1144522 RepID=A0A1J4KLX4_9EUKA|nr:hypothetical protein TRFO_19772 [Tritrichomonas foetus]|eukprot:OHT10804.1 hypothetical protein TRFO_19772 [Tritrichomonas foetus]
MANKDMIQIYKQRLVHSIELQTMLQSIDLISVEEIAKSISGNDYFCTKEGKNRLLKILFASIKSFPKFMKRYS